MMRKLVLMAALVAAAAACNGGDDGNGFEATLTGSAETPAIVTTSLGYSTVNVGGDQTDYTIDAQNLTNATVAHIHAGAPGQAGPPVVFLFQTASPVTLANGTLSVGTFDATDMIPSANISYDSLMALIRNGNAYVNVHTSAHPAGEIRGQLVRD
jgi:CHRD domain